MQTSSVIAIIFLLGEIFHSACSAKNIKAIEAPVVEASVNECKFKYRDFYNGFRKKDSSGYYGVDPYYPSGTLLIDFRCRPFEEKDKGVPAASYAYKDIDQDENNGAMRDPITGRWVIHPIVISADDAKAMDTNPEQIKALSTSRYGGQLNAVNATGYYRVENNTMGEESGQTRRFEACLMHPPLVLCALSLDAGLLREPRKSLVPYMIKLLQTVEFTTP
jgi:hypothetical protein